MPAAPPARKRASFDFKRTTFPLISLVLRTADLVELENELQDRLGDSPDFFDQDLLVINLSALRQANAAIDFRALAGLLRRYRVQPIGVHGGSPSQMQAAADAGLVATPEVSAAQSIARAARSQADARSDDSQQARSDGRSEYRPENRPGSVTEPDAGEASAAGAASPAPLAAAAPAIAEATGAADTQGLVDTQVAPDTRTASDAALAGGAPTASEVPAASEAPLPAEAPVPPPLMGAVVIDKPLRSGQRVYAKGADLIVLAVVSFGAEVFADGNIHVYAPLRGRAIAGARGKTDARIFCTCMEPQLVAIAGVYRTIETALPPDVAGKPAQVRLVGESLVIEPL